MVTGLQVVARADSWLSEALSAIDGDVILSSPYLSYDVCRRISDVCEASAHRFQLSTKLDASAVANGYLSIQGLELLLKVGVELRHVERLHAKCFIVGSRGMLGSANLTGAGLGSSANRNYELGVALDAGLMEQALAAMSSWPAESITGASLAATLERAKALTSIRVNVAADLKPDTRFHLAEQLLIDARDEKRALWIKLEHGEPSLDGWRAESYFASPKRGEVTKGRPKFKVGDLVLVCAKATHDCYVIVEVTGEAEFQPVDYVEWNGADSEAVSRWPWVNRTVPRLVPDQLVELKLQELGVDGRALQSGHTHLAFDAFTSAVRSLSRQEI